MDFWGFFLFPLRSIFVFFRLDFFTITDFGDDGSVADGGTKSVIIIIDHRLIVLNFRILAAFVLFSLLFLFFLLYSFSPLRSLGVYKL